MATCARATWKAFERRVANFFNGVRTPASGSLSRHTAGDMISDRIYSEAKSNWVCQQLKQYYVLEACANRAKKIPVFFSVGQDQDSPLLIMTHMKYYLDLIILGSKILPEPEDYEIDKRFQVCVEHEAAKDALRTLVAGEYPKSVQEGKVFQAVIGLRRRSGFWIIHTYKDFIERVRPGYASQWIKTTAEVNSEILPGDTHLPETGFVLAHEKPGIRLLAPAIERLGAFDGVEVCEYSDTFITHTIP